MAENFCDKKGQIWKIKDPYPDSCVVCGIQMAWISNYSSEKEVLLFNSLLPIVVTETFVPDVKQKVNIVVNQLMNMTSVIRFRNSFIPQLDC